MNIALVQFYSYHEEVLSPQIDFLRHEHKLFIAAPSSVINNDYISCYKEQFEPILFKKNGSSFLARLFSIFGKYIILNKAHKKYNFDIIIFNTITKYFHIKLINFFFKDIKKIHIIHNGKLYKSKLKRAKYLNNFYTNLFISHDIYNKFHDLSKNDKKTPSINWFCPLLPSDIIKDYNSKNIVLNENDINIVIPGSVDIKRRNYFSLFKALEKYKNKNSLKFKIFLLGKIKPDTLDYLKLKGIDSLITYFTEYVGGHDMLYCVKKADAVAFLLDSGMGKSFLDYNSYKLPGAVNLCLTFSTPCIVSNELKLEFSLHDKAMFYMKDNIDSILEAIEDGSITKLDFDKLKSVTLDAQYGYLYQKEHYLKALGLN
jgi:hypothetical protein